MLYFSDCWIHCLIGKHWKSMHILRVITLYLNSRYSTFGSGHNSRFSHMVEAMFIQHGPKSLDCSLPFHPWCVCPFTSSIKSWQVLAILCERYGVCFRFVAYINNLKTNREIAHLLTKKKKKWSLIDLVSSSVACWFIIF